jgi:uncharacterized protein (TIGR03067 family)
MNVDLQGTWRAVRVETGAGPVPDEVARRLMYVFKGDQVTLFEGEQVTGTGTVAVHPETTPQAIDVQMSDGPEQGKTAQGICEVVGDRLRLCIGPERPTGFQASGPASLVELERAGRAVAAPPGRRPWRRLLLPILLVALLVASTAAFWVARPKERELRLEVEGTRGLEFTGTCEVNGVTQELEGTVPTDLVFHGTRMTYTLRPTQKSGMLWVRYHVDGRACSFAGSKGSPPKGVRGWVKSDWEWSETTHWIEPFETEGEPKWLKPPPP